VPLVEQWREIERGLPPGWSEARLALTIDGEPGLRRAAALLGPLNPGRAGTTLRFVSGHTGTVAGPQAVSRALQRLDRERIEGRLELVAASDQPAPTVPAQPRSSLAAEWDAATTVLPDDWSDGYAEVVLRSTDQVERAALLIAPLNPLREGERPALRFRFARRFGYGASASMARRCLERLDEEDIRGQLAVLRVLSNTDPVQTQGPVWYVGGRSV
jgi:hypothetical protein